MNCLKCGASNVEGTRFCKICGHERGLAFMPPESAPPSPDDARVRVPQRGKKPIVALILSLLIPGIGQFYNGEAKKGVIILCVWIVSLPFVASGIGVIGVSGAWIWGMIDAYKVASVASLTRS
jgi:TM2 domain-containing membrane protein YozV